MHLPILDLNKEREGRWDDYSDTFRLRTRRAGNPDYIAEHNRLTREYSDPRTGEMSERDAVRIGYLCMIRTCFVEWASTDGTPITDPYTGEEMPYTADVGEKVFATEYDKETDAFVPVHPEYAPIFAKWMSIALDGQAFHVKAAETGGKKSRRSLTGSSSGAKSNGTLKRGTQKTKTRANSHTGRRSRSSKG